MLDVSCRKKEDGYYVVTDRWQKMTKERVSTALLERLSGYADEFLVHAVDVEGQARGIEKELVEMLGMWCKSSGNDTAIKAGGKNAFPSIIYAGGVGSFADLEELAQIGQGCVNVTIGSALDLFGGKMSFKEVIKFCAKS